jgi:hypothetical protein
MAVNNMGFYLTKKEIEYLKKFLDGNMTSRMITKYDIERVFYKGYFSETDKKQALNYLKKFKYDASDKTIMKKLMKDKEYIMAVNISFAAVLARVFKT